MFEFLANLVHSITQDPFAPSQDRRTNMFTTRQQCVQFVTGRSNTIDQETLFSLLSQQGCAQIEVDGVRGYLDYIQREDGSGHSFNIGVRFLRSNASTTVYVRVPRTQ